MTYNVFGGTLSLTQSINHLSVSVCVVSRRSSRMISTVSCAVWLLKCLMFTTLTMRGTSRSIIIIIISSSSSMVVKSPDDELAAGWAIHTLARQCLSAISSFKLSDISRV